MARYTVSWINHTQFEQEWEDGEPVGRPKYVRGWSTAGKKTKKRQKKQKSKKKPAEQAQTEKEPGNLF